MTLSEALLADSCTFPSYTLALHKRTANELDILTRRLEEAESRAAAYEAALADSCDKIEKLLRIIPNNAEALEIVKDTFHSTEGQ